MDQIHLLVEIVTPLILGAIFIINLLQSRSQQENKQEILEYNDKIKDTISNLRGEIGDLRTEVRVHAGKDEEYQRGISRTLTRMDQKLDK